MTLFINDEQKGWRATYSQVYEPMASEMSRGTSHATSAKSGSSILSMVTMAMHILS